MVIIPKFLQGGGFGSFFTIYQPTLTESPNQIRSSKSSKSDDDDDDTKGKLTEKDLFTMLKDLDGLPNEMSFMLRNMITTINNAKATGKEGILDLVTSYLKNLYSLKEAKYNKDYFDKTYLQAVTNKSLSEVAIDPTGDIWITDKSGQLMSVSPEKWAKIKDSNQYQVVTNGNLLWMRSHLPQYANKNLLLRIVENGIGLEEVHKMIKDRFEKIGNTESSVETYIPKEAVKGHEILEKALAYGPEGIYKIKQDLSKPEEAQIQATLAYIYSTLPANAKTRLAIETPDGTLKSVQNVISSLLFGTLNYKLTYSSDYEGTEGKGVSADGKSVSDNELNAAMKLISGLGAPETFRINIGDEYYKIVGASTQKLVKNKGEEPVVVGEPISEIFTSSLGSVLDTRNMSIGGSPISPSLINRIIVTEPKVRTIDYPCIRIDNGLVVPDLSKETSEKKRKADEELTKMGINPYNREDLKNKYQTINQIYLKHLLVAPYNADGSINSNTWARFSVIPVALDERSLGENANKSVLEEVFDDFEADNIASNIEASDKNYSLNKPILGVGGDSIYKGELWILTNDSYSLASDTKSTSKAIQYNMWDQANQNKALLTTKLFY